MNTKLSVFLKRLTSQDPNLTSFKYVDQEMTETDAKKIAAALSVNTFLTELNLNDNKIGNAGAAAIASALENNTTLTHLSLGNNCITDEGIADLAYMLEKNTTLTSLYIRFNECGERGKFELCSALKNNYTLTNLAMNSYINRPFDEIGEKINIALETNVLIEAALKPLKKFDYKNLTIKIIQKCLIKLKLLITKFDSLNSKTYPKEANRLLNSLMALKQRDLKTATELLSTPFKHPQFKKIAEKLLMTQILPPNNASIFQDLMEFFLTNSTVPQIGLGILLIISGIAVVIFSVLLAVTTTAMALGLTAPISVFIAIGLSLVGLFFIKAGASMIYNSINPAIDDVDQLLDASI